MANVRINLAGLDTAKKAVEAAAKKTVRAVAFGIQAQAIQNIEDVDAIDTGSLRNSIYVETKEESQREGVLAKALATGREDDGDIAEFLGVSKSEIGKHVRKASGGNPAVQAADPPAPIEGEYQARVASCVEHGIYVEMGVTGSATGDHDPRPFLTPAAHTVGEKAEGVLAAFLAEELGR